jgi:hypothetical protein
MAGLTMRLVQRRDVRYEPTKASPAAATLAAAGPWMSSSRKMKISPAAKEFFECGMRTGKTPASIAMAMPTDTCSQACGVRSASETPACTSTAAPSATTVHQ